MLAIQTAGRYAVLVCILTAVAPPSGLRGAEPASTPSKFGIREKIVEFLQEQEKIGQVYRYDREPETRCKAFASLYREAAVKAETQDPAGLMEATNAARDKMLAATDGVYYLNRELWRAVFNPTIAQLILDARNAKRLDFNQREDLKQIYTEIAEGFEAAEKFFVGRIDLILGNAKFFGGGLAAGFSSADRFSPRLLRRHRRCR